MWEHVVAAIVLAFCTAVSIAFRASTRYSTTRPSKQPAPLGNDDTLDGPTLSLVVVVSRGGSAALHGLLASAVDYCRDAVRRCEDDETSRREGVFAAFEIIVVDDGGAEDAAAAVSAVAKRHPDERVRLISLTPSRGAGYAARTGFFAAAGDYVLLLEARDGIDVRDTAKLMQALRKPSSHLKRRRLPPVIAVGADSSQTTIGGLVSVSSRIAYLAATRGASCPVPTPHAPLRLFDRRACTPLFLSNRIDDDVAAVELLVLARQCRLAVASVPVAVEKTLAPRRIAGSAARYALECALLCFVYGLGVWGVIRK